MLSPRHLVVVMAALAAVMTTTGPTALAASTAAARPLRVLPAAGTDQSPVTLVTAGACPTPATNIVARIYGAGFASGGQNIVGNESAGVSSYGPFEVSPVYDFAQMVQLMSRPQPMHGSYRLVVSCRTPRVARSYRDYVGVLRFSSAHHWAAIEPGAAVATVRQVAAAQARAQGLQQDAAQAPTKSSDNGPSRSAHSSRTAPQAAPASAAVASRPGAAGRHTNPRGWYVALLLLGLALAGGVTLAFLPRRHRSRNTPSDISESVAITSPSEPVSQ